MRLLAGMPAQPLRDDVLAEFDARTCNRPSSVLVSPSSAWPPDEAYLSPRPTKMDPSGFNTRAISAVAGMIAASQSRQCASDTISPGPAPEERTPKYGGLVTTRSTVLSRRGRWS